MPLFTDTETARINRLILMGGNTGMTELQFFAAEIDEWEAEPQAERTDYRGCLL